MNEDSDSDQDFNNNKIKEKSLIDKDDINFMELLYDKNIIKLVNDR